MIAPQRYFRSTDVIAALDGMRERNGRTRDPVTVAYRVHGSDRAWDPTSTHRTIGGPALVKYTLWPDGGIDVAILAPDWLGQKDDHDG